MNNQSFNQGSSLSDIDQSGRNEIDMNLVHSILSDANIPSTNNPVMQQHYGQGQGHVPVMNAQQQYTTYPNAADPVVATAHMIGRESPTQGDFQRMMMQPAPTPIPYNAVSNDTYLKYDNGQQNMSSGPVKNSHGKWIDEFREPILVAILAFIITLPAIKVLVSHYAPSLLHPGGEFTSMGMVVRAIAAGALFWFLKQVVVPLLTL